MLSNAYFLAKFRFDTAENEPAKNLQKFANFPNFANPSKIGKIWTTSTRTAGSFSAVSKRNFASKCAFDSIFQALPDVLTFPPLQSQNFSNKSVWKIRKFRENSAKSLQMLQILQNVAKFQKNQLDNLVDFEKCWKTRICLQRSAPIQPKTSEILPRFCKKAFEAQIFV